MVFGNKAKATDIPEEYSRIKKVINRLARFNDLGSNPLVFTVIAGGYTGFLGSQGSESPEKFHLYRQLDPFRKDHDLETAEAIRQGYLFGDWEGYAFTNGTIAISRATFRITQNVSNDAYLACTLAHELGHVLGSHVFNESYDISILDKVHKRRSKRFKHLKSGISRMYETLADESAWEMMANAGYKQESCINALKLLHESSGLGAVTSASDTHPGYRDRVKSLKRYMNERGLSARQKTNSTNGTWNYNADLNTLSFIPDVY